MAPKFTKKHYIEIARMLGHTALDEHTIEVLIQSFARVFTEDNPEFNIERFRRMVWKERFDD